MGRDVMADRYASIAELVKSERRDIDFRIRQSNRPGTIAVIAPHGGGIEPGTAEIAEAIAGAKYSVYAFEGIKAKGNHVLHVTSVRFDEPECVALVAASERAIAIHGEGSTDPFVHPGGRGDETVEGLVIAHEADESIRYALAAVPRASIQLYEVEFRLRPAEKLAP